MNAREAAQRVAEHSLVENRSLSVELMPWARTAAATAASGDLKRALRQLGYDERLAALGAVRPAALAAARRRLAELPAPGVLRIPLVQSFLWFGFIALVQAMVLAIQGTKVFPVLNTMLADHQVPTPVWAEIAEAVLPWFALILGGVGLLGWRAPTWLPGWGRTLRRAREAAIGSALAETLPPEDVWSGWVRGSPVLARLGAATAPDLRVLGHAWGRQAEQQMARFVTVYRFAGFALLTLIALAVTAYVYGATAMLVRAN